MAYESGFLQEVVKILNRKPAVKSKMGLDASGIEWDNGVCVHANVGYQKGKSGMMAGSLDVYTVKIVRMRYNTIVNERSRIEYDGKTYQIVGETFNANRHTNEIQFLMQVVNDK